MINKLRFLLTDSIRTLLRAKLPAAISSMTIGISLVIFSLAYFTYENLLGYSHKFKSRYRIEVFFYNDLGLIKSQDLFNTILIMDGIEEGEFIDKERASKLFTSFFHENIEDALIFGNALAVSENTSMLTTVANRIESLAFMTGGGWESYKKAVFRFLLLA